MTDSSGPNCISVINMKGGVGKTTIAALLGRYASRTLKRRVVAIDLDPQANLSQAFMREGYKKFLDEHWPSVVELFHGYVPPGNSVPTPTPLSLDKLLVAETPLGGPNLELIPSRFDFSDNLVNSIKVDPRILARFIVSELQDRDIVLIDCAPTESIFTQAAYHASRHILVPVKPEYFATIGFPLLSDSLQTFKKSNPSHLLDVAGIVINNSTYHYSGNSGGPERVRAISDIRVEARRNGWVVFEHQIPLSPGLSENDAGRLQSPWRRPAVSTICKGILWQDRRHVVNWS